MPSVLSYVHPIYLDRRDFDPDVVACGENHALYAHEALRFFQLCADVAPRARRVAGGEFSAEYLDSVLSKRFVAGAPEQAEILRVRPNGTAIAIPAMQQITTSIPRRRFLTRLDPQV